MLKYKAHIESQVNKVRDPWIPVSYKVTGKKKENASLVTITLEPTGQHHIQEMHPGQFNMLYAFGVGEIPISTSSLLSSPGKITHTIQDVGAVSKACCDVGIGDQLGIRGPFGTSWPVEKARNKDVIIMAGGVGIAPLRPLIESIQLERDHFGEVNILYGTRSPEDIIFHQDLISWQADTSINFFITVDHAYLHWRGNVGVVTNLVEKARFNPENTTVYLCGPEIMMRYGAYTCLDQKIPDEHIYLSMERNMKCAIGHCGHCQYGPFFVCKDGPVFAYPVLRSLLNINEL